LNRICEAIGTQGDLRGTVKAAKLSRRTMRNTPQNLFFAFVYNALGVPIAAEKSLSVHWPAAQPDDRRRCDEFQQRFRGRKLVAMENCKAHVSRLERLPVRRRTDSGELMMESNTEPEKPEPKRPLVLLTGATGYIGSHLLLRLQQRNVPVRCLARKPDNLRIVSQHIRLDYQQARASRTALETFRERTGVYRDYTHLVITLCRCMNIPARYCTGYLGDIGVPPSSDPMDFSAWFQAFLGGTWYAFDPRNNVPRIGRVLMARGRDGADAALTTTFGVNQLESFKVWANEVSG
jgi:hypothetical protein